MNTNPILGRYDMVLALSQDKINAEFENLYDDGNIENTLEFLTDITGTKRLTSKSPDYASIKKSWLEQENLNKNLSILDQDLILLSDQQSKALEEDDFILAKQLSEKLKVKRKELESLRKNTSEVNGYSYLIDAQIKSPEIQILSGNNSNLLYKLRFESGSLYSLVEHKIRKTDLSEKIYAFNVPIGKIQITSEQMVLVDDKIEILSAGGFDDNQFTIESIFLNFNNANISTFDKSQSILPEDQTVRTDLQVAVTNYFEKLKNAHEHYVLGYSIQKKNVNTKERAMLHPTSASFSTSFSSIDRASAFNFLMQTENKNFPKDTDAGILKGSLIEAVIAQDPPVDGSIAIDFPIFKDLYLNKLKEAVADNLEKGFREKLSEAYRGRSFENGYTRYHFTMGKIWVDYKLEDAKLQNLVMPDGSTAIKLTHRIYANGNAHDEIEKSVIFGLIDTGTVGVNQRVSTSGSWPINGKIGSEGSLTLTIRASKQGKVTIETEYKTPSIGKDTEKAEYKDNLDKYWDKLSSLVNPFGLAILLYSLFTDDGHDIANFNQDGFQEIPFDNLDNFSSKIVLPGSNTFAFKNVRSSKGTFNTDDIILFDITYAPNTTINNG